MNSVNLDKRLPLIQDSDLNGKIVLVRFDHNAKYGVFIEWKT